MKDAAKIDANVPEKAKEPEHKRPKEDAAKGAAEGGGVRREGGRDSLGAEQARDAATKKPNEQKEHARSTDREPRVERVTRAELTSERNKPADQAEVKQRETEAEAKSRDIAQPDRKEKATSETAKARQEAQESRERQAKETDEQAEKAQELRNLAKDQPTQRNRQEAQDAALGHTATWAPVRSLEEERLKGTTQQTRPDVPYGGAPVVVPEQMREAREAEAKRSTQQPNIVLELSPGVAKQHELAESRYQQALRDSPEFAKRVDELTRAVERGPHAKDEIIRTLEQMDFRTKPSSAVFWSGGGDFNLETGELEDSRLRAERFCARENVLGGTWTILEHTPSGRALDKLGLWTDKRFSYEERTAIWDAASRFYAEQAAGTVVVFERGKGRPYPDFEGHPGSAYMGPSLDRVEMEALRKNGAVTNIITDDPVLFEGNRLYQRQDLSDPRA